MKILVAVDGSKASLDAVKYVIDHAADYKVAPSVELVTVHREVPKLPGMGAAVGKTQIQRYYMEEGEEVMTPSMKLLDKARITYQPHVLVGDPAQRVVEHAVKSKCELIVVGSKGRTAVGKMLVGSVATKVLQLSDIPVLLVK